MIIQFLHTSRACALALLALPASGFAGAQTASKSIVEKAAESCISGDLGINLVSQYVNRGFIFENQGAILQPFADLNFKLYEGEGFVNNVSLALGIWNSFQSRHTDAGEAGGAAGSSTPGWYEFDFTAGLAITFAKTFTFTPSYQYYSSPNDGFTTFHGLNLKLAYDTTDLLGFNLAPTLQVLFELEGKVDGSTRDQGIYYEVGLAPSFPVGPLAVSIPLLAGFGSEDFYPNNQGFGYASAGVLLSYPLAFIPACYGTWTATAGYAYYYLGDALSSYNTQPANDIRDARRSEHIFSGGLLIAF